MLAHEVFCLFDAWPLMAGVLPAPLRAVAAQRSNPLRRICPPQESPYRQTTDKTKGPVFRLSLLLYLMPGSSLLSHGETPHYHRRYGVSLLSSAWGQVGPPRYCRQANSVTNTPSGLSVNLYQLKISQIHHTKQLWRCKVKPHGSLVSVSSTYRYAYTPDLSTS